MNASQRPAPPRFTPISPDTPQDRFAKTLACYLAQSNLDATGALPHTIAVLGAVQAALDAGDLSAGVERVLNDMRSHNTWAARHHPKMRRYEIPDPEDL